MSSEKKPLYAITVEEFATFHGPSAKNYTLGEPVNRHNLVAYWKDMFAKSLGITTGQYIHGWWTELQTGFDYINSGRNYFKAGGWDILIPEEQSSIQEDYQRVAEYQPKHNIPPDKFGKEFDIQIARFIWPAYSVSALHDFQLTKEQLAQLTAPQVVRLITDYSKRYKAGEIY